MIRLDDVLADLQLINHRVRYTSFFLPFGNISLDNCDFEYDYRILNIDYENEPCEGTVVFEVKLVQYGDSEDNPNTDILNFALEGRFIGNKNNLTEESFYNFLELNGIVTLSQLTRSIIISMTSNFGLNEPIRIPMINVHQLNQLKQLKLEKDKMEAIEKE